MNHKISNGQFSKILNSLPAVIFLLLWFLLFLTENICLCNYCKFNIRIFKTTFRMTINNHDFSWLNHTIILFSIKSIQFFIHQIFGETFRSCTGTCHQHRLISLLFIFLQIFYEKLKTIIKRTDGTNS